MAWPSHLTDGVGTFGAAQINPIIDALSAAGGNRNGNGYDLGANRYAQIAALQDAAANTLVLFSASYAFSRAPGGSLTGGTPATATLAPVPLGLNAADVGHYVELPDHGTAEAVLITGGTAVAGASTGTITFTPAHSHSAGWTVSSASVGIQEALIAAGAGGGGICLIPAGTFTLHATISVPTGIQLYGAGLFSTTLTRTEDYGSTFVLAGVNSVLFSDFFCQHVISFNPSPFPGTITNKPTSGAHFLITDGNSIRFENVRCNDMPHNVVLNGGADITFDCCQFQGLWEPSSSTVQVTSSSIQVNSSSGHIATYIKIKNSQFYGYSAAGSGQTNSGPRYMVEINGCEDLEITGGAAGGASIANVGLFPASGQVILANVRILGVKFDAARLGEVVIGGDGVLSASEIIISNNLFNSENQTTYGLDVLDATTGAPSVIGLTMTGNSFMACLSTALHIMDGVGFTICGNSVRYYNVGNGFSTPEFSSGIHIGGRANNGVVYCNPCGGGQAYANFGSGGNACQYGLTLALPTSAQNNILYALNQPPSSAMVDHPDPEAIGSRLQAYADKFIRCAAQVNVTGAASLIFENAAGTSNVPAEFRASKFSFQVGLGVHADNTAALAAGLTAGDAYRTSTGVFMVTF